jgi:TRAP-type C4-dicarboxylate transport system permease small subunit
MTETSSVICDDSWLSRIDTFMVRIEKFLTLISGAAVIGLMVLAVVSVGGRNFFNRPLPGYVDLIEILMPLIAFMGISYVQREGGHIRMDMVIGSLKGRWLWLSELITVLLTFLLISALIYGSWEHFLRSFDFASVGWSRDSSIDIGLPLWPAKLLVPVALSILALRLIVQAAGYIAAISGRLETPVAVPLHKDVVRQAKDEAEQLQERELK